MNEDDGRTGDQPGPGDIGSVSEEAAKLFGALSGWAKTQGSDIGHGVSDAAAGAAHAMHDVNEHVATGSAECTYCPICRTMHVIRELSPEVRNHIATAGANLMQAAAALMATAVPDQSQPRSSGKDDLEKIDVDDEWPEDE
ncbi:MAG: hypothetical protein L0H93_06355 [Nocardioides sp.]|nr:hypothetical protein [Nocardioides sp.]